MKHLLWVTLFISSVLHANNTATNLSLDLNLTEKNIIELTDQEIGLNNTCLDEYLTRQTQLRKFLIWAPPATVVATPTGFFVAGFSTAFVTSTIGLGGWNALGYTILGAVGTSVGIVGSFVYLETSKGIEYFTNNRMIQIITAAHSDRDNNKHLSKLFKKYNKKYSRKPLSMNELKKRIIELDEKGLLCDGTVRGYLNPKNLKYSLAKRKHLMKYIFYYQ